MAIAFDTGDYLSRSTGLLSAGAGCTVCCWVKRTGGTPTGGTYRTVFVQGNVAGAYTSWAGIFSDVDADTYLVSVSTGGSGATTASATLAVNVWTHLAYTRSGNTHTFYVNGISQGTATLAFGAATVDGMWLASDTDALSVGGIECAYYREWSVALTAAAIRAEMVVTTPATTSNLYTDTPIATSSDLADDSGNAHDWTGTGSLTTATSPAFPANQDAADAVAVSALPYGTSFDLMGTDVTLWFSYTPEAGDYFGLYGYPTPAPTGSLLTGYFVGITVWTGTPGSLTQTDYSDLAFDLVDNRPLIAPIVMGTTYYISVRTRTLGESTLPTVAISFLAPPNTLAPAGSLLINDDTTVGAPNFPAFLLSATDGDPLQLLPNIVSGEMGDVMADGVFALSDVSTAGVAIYNASGTLRATTSALTTVHGTQQFGGQVRAAGSTFYLAQTTTGTTTTRLWRCTTAGVLSAPVTVTTTTAALRAMGVTTDEASAYWVYQGNRDIINTWDLGTDTAGATFWTAPVSAAFVPDILTYADGSVICGQYYRHAVTGGSIYVIDAGGSTVRTITTGVAGLNRLSRIVGDDTAFWAWFEDETLNTSTFKKYQISDGSVLTTFTVPFFAQGVGFEEGVAGPTRFQHSSSCPLLIMPLAFSSGGGSGGSGGENGLSGVTLQTMPIRWLRKAPHLCEEQARMFHTRLQLDMNVGNGLRTGQGSDPQVMLRWSDDGGFTWSNVHLGNTGRRGQYRTRVQWYRLGSGRDRVYEISGSDPVETAIVDGYLDVEQGTS